MKVFSQESRAVMEISVASESVQLVVSLKGEMDRTVYGEGIRQIRQEFERSPRDVVVDCEGLRHVSSGAVAGFSRLRETIEKQGKSLQFANLARDVADVFARGGFGVDRAHRVSTDPQAALAELAPPPGRLAFQESRLAPQAPALGPRLGEAPALGGADLVSEVGRIKQDLALAEADLRAAREETEQAQGERQKTQEQLAETKARLLTLQEENVKLARELQQRPAPSSEESPAENDQLRVEAIALRKERDRLREDLANARDQVKTFRDAYAGLERDLQRMEEMKERVASSQDELKMARQDLQFAREKLTSTVDLNRSMEEQVQILQQDLLAARETVRRHEAKFAELKRFISVELG